MGMLGPWDQTTTIWVTACTTSIGRLAEGEVEDTQELLHRERKLAVDKSVSEELPGVSSSFSDKASLFL